MSSNFFNELSEIFTFIHLTGDFFEDFLLLVRKELTLFLELSFDCIEIYKLRMLLLLL